LESNIGKGIGKRDFQRRGEAKRIINESIKSAESKKREALVEAKEEILKASNDYEREAKERRADSQAGAPSSAKGREPGPQNREYREKGRHNFHKNGTAEESRNEVALVKKSQMELLERISALPQTRPRPI
jgi:ribonuclease Y